MSSARESLEKETLYWWIISLTFAVPSGYVWSISALPHLTEPEEINSNLSRKTISPGIKWRAKMVVINTLLTTPKLYMAGGSLCQLRSSFWEFIFHVPDSIYLASKEFELCHSVTFTLSLQLCTVSWNQEMKLKGLFFLDKTLTWTASNSQPTLAQFVVSKHDIISKVKF